MELSPQHASQKAQGYHTQRNCFLEQSLLEGTYNKHLVQAQLVFFDRSINIAEKEMDVKVTHTVLLPVISVGRQTAAKKRSKTTGRSSKL